MLLQQIMSQNKLKLVVSIRTTQHFARLYYMNLE